MTCKEALELVEPIAAADIAVDAIARAHFETCPGCAAVLASARRVEMMLAGREVPLAPPGFTPAVMQRLRRQRWRSEQRVDYLFNAAIAVALLLIAGGIFALMNISGVMAAAGGTWTARGVARGAARPDCGANTRYLRCGDRAPAVSTGHVVVGRAEPVVLDQPPFPSRATSASAAIRASDILAFAVDRRRILPVGRIRAVVAGAAAVDSPSSPK